MRLIEMLKNVRAANAVFEEAVAFDIHLMPWNFSGLANFLSVSVIKRTHYFISILART